MLDAQAGLTTADVARRYRVGEDKIRTWIKAGLLAAINTASVTCARPRYVITPESLTKFEAARAAGPAPKPKKRPRNTGQTDYYPD